MTAPFGHVLTAMITPFADDGAVDHATVWDLVHHLLATGSDGIVVAGTTGESPTLSDDEKLALFRAVKDAAGERGTVVAGTGTYDTAHSVHLTEAAAEIGCDGVMAVTPYYSRPSQEGLYRHFVAIADASDLPVLLYNIPSRTGRRIEVETIARLSEHPNIVAVKDAVGSVAFTSETRVAVGDEFGIYSGDDVLTLPMIAAGGEGVVSVAAHLAGVQIQRMVTAALEGDWALARRLHLALFPLNKALFLEPNPMPLKAALNALWEPVGEPRLPLVTASDETVQAVKEALGTAQAG
ncbi:MAG: 4-hydroxy-tetrahydrodipicolinate synthase [Acidimicrobiia bacterium]|nr:4-hydroxy-tetrahydrodipicolinate synthase [Acidimicrobiia bacterium]